MSMSFEEVQRIIDEAMELTKSAQAQINYASQELKELEKSQTEKIQALQATITTLTTMADHPDEIQTGIGWGH